MIGRVAQRLERFEKKLREEVISKVGGWCGEPFY